MYTGDKKYDPTVLDNDESAERLRHEEEMQEALKRLSDRSARKRRSFLAAAFGVLVGLLYILWITFGPGIMLNDGQSLYEAYISLAGTSGAMYAVLDFAPPVVLAAALALIAARKERGKFYFVVTAILTTAIVVAVFMLYMSMMAGA